MVVQGDSLFLQTLKKFEKIKNFYPVITAISFIPTVFIYYNDSALIHSVWYLVVSAAGIGVGMLLKRV